MDDYISREAARPDAFCEGVSCQECPFLKDPVKGGCKVDDFIKALPTADARPVPEGQWVELQRNTPNPITGRCGVYVGCSNCHAPLPTDSFLDYLNESDSKFCYSCGAKMGGTPTE